MQVYFYHLVHNDNYNIGMFLLNIPSLSIAQIEEKFIFH